MREVTDRQMLLWDFMVECSRPSDFNHRFAIDLSGFVDATEFLNRAIRDMTEAIKFSSEMDHWESQHRVPRRRRTRPRDNRNACEKGRRRKDYHRGDRVGFSSGSWIYNGDDVVIRGNKRWVPPLPDDFGEALWEAIMEEHGWPIEDDDSHPETADYQKRARQQKELDALYYEDYMSQLDREWEEDLAYEDLIEQYPDALVGKDSRGDGDKEADGRSYCDKEYEAWRADYRNGGWADGRDDYDY